MMHLWALPECNLPNMPAMKQSLEYLTSSGILGGDSTKCVETRSARARKRAMETDNRGAENPIYHLHHAVVMIALVRHLGMDKKDNTVVERVREMEHVPRTDTSHRRAPHRLIT